MNRATTRVAAIGSLGAGGVLATAAPTLAVEDATGIEQIWSGLTDSRGNQVDDFSTLSFYDGGWTGTEQKIFGPLTELVWGWYAYLARAQIIILDWVMALGWKDFVLGPLNALSNVLATIMSILGLRPLMLMILAVGVALLLFRRRSGTAISELFVGASIAAVAVGILANPMAVVAGDNGAITQAQNVGMTLATAINTGGDSMEASNNEEMRNALTEQLVDSLLRTPHQIINYGQIIDGTPCEDAYNEALGDEDGRLVVGACDPALQEAADNPNSGTLVNALRLHPAISAFTLFTSIIALISLACVLACGWYGLKLAWDLILGIAPGSSRVGLFRSLGGLAASLGVLALSIPFVVVYMKIISGVTGAAGGPVAALFRFDLITLFLLLGAVVLIAFWMRMRRSGRNLASALSRLGKQQSAPAPHQVSAATRVREGMRDVTQITRNAQNLKNGRGAGETGFSRSAPEPVEQVTSNRQAPTQPSDQRTQRVPSTSDTAANTPAASPDTATTAPERLQTRMKKGAKTAAELGAHVGTAAATGGTSLAATGGKAAAVAGSASKAAKAAKVARTAHTRVQQVKVAVQEGTQRAQRTSQNHELRRTLNRSQNAEATPAGQTPSPAASRPRAAAATATEKTAPGGGRQVKTPAAASSAAAAVAGSTPGRQGSQDPTRSSKPDASSSRGQDEKRPARPDGQSTSIDRLRQRLREVSGR